VLSEPAPITARLAALARRRPELVIVAVALLARLVWVAIVARNVPDPARGDQYWYWYWGREIAAGHGYLSSETGEAVATYPVGYLVVLAGLFRLADALSIPGGDAAIVGVYHAVIGALSVWLVYVIGKAAFGRRVGLVAAAVLAVFPSSVYVTATYSIEPTFIVLTLASLALVVAHDWSTPLSPFRSIALATSFAAAVVVRPFALPFLAVIVVAAWRGRGWKQALRTGGLCLVALTVLVAPWAIRNEARFGVFVPFSTNLGDTMCMSRYPGSDARFHWADHEWCADPALPQYLRNDENIKLALRFIRTHPGEEARLVVLRFREMMRHDHETLGEATSVHAGSLGDGTITVLARLADWTFFVAGFASLAGLVLLGRRRLAETNVQSVLLTAGYLLAIPLGLWGAVRFHAPLVPFIVLLATFAAVELTVRVQARAWARLGERSRRGR